jgi:hypothetical protein
MRDITLEDTIYLNFTTRAFSTGVPTTLAGTPVLSVLESNNATPITAGVSVSVDRASVTGLNQATVVATAANGYEVGKSYSLYISTGTVGGVSVVGEVVGQFTIQTSAAAVDLANATDGLGALKTLIDAVDNFVDTEIADIQARLPAALTADGNIKADTLHVGGTLQTPGDVPAMITAVDDFVDTEVSAIKTQTDKLTFTVANVLDSNVLRINGVAAAAATLAILNGAAVVYSGAVTGAATTTTLIDSGLTQADTDWWKGRIILFTSVITLQATEITGFDPATDKLTFTATTQAPTGATYVII